MEPVINKTHVRQILTSIMVLTRLYSASIAEYRREWVSKEISDDKYVTVMEADYNYVCLKRRKKSMIMESIKQVGLCDDDLSIDHIKRILAHHADRYTPQTCNRYVLEGQRLVSKPIGGSNMSHLLVITDECPSSTKDRLMVHVSLLKEYLPYKLDDVDFLIEPVIEEHKEVDISIKCILCKERPRDILIRPCNHIVVCLPCAHQLSDYKCPRCKVALTALERVYL